MKRRCFNGIVVLAALLFILGCSRSSAGEVDQLTAAQAYALIQARQGDSRFVILDLRTPAEFNQGHIAGAVLLDFRNPGFRQALDRLDRGLTYLIYCRTGNRSGKALKFFHEMGFNKIHHLEAGIVSWAAAGLPIVR